MIDLSTDEVRNNFQTEAKFSRRLARHGIGAKHIADWECDGVGFIVTERWDGELPRHGCPPPNVLRKLYDQIIELSHMGLVHSDILEKNILVRYNDVDGEIIDATLTDFGLMKRVKMFLRDPDWVEVMYEYHVNPANNTHYYYKENNVTLHDVQRNPYHLDIALIWHLYDRCGLTI